MTKNLRTVFRCDETDQSEFELLLITHFGGSQSDTDSEIRYTRGHQAGPARRTTKKAPAALTTGAQVKLRSVFLDRRVPACLHERDR
jgi:hypothetical protein